MLDPEELLAEMRSSLVALQQAVASNGSEADGAASTREPGEPVDGPETDEDVLLRFRLIQVIHGDPRFCIKSGSIWG
jgi:hypothetical protein